jgi:hypothetical protein
MSDYVKCPFCGEDDFDLIGLKNHFVAGYCEAFNAVEELGRSPRERIAPEPATSGENISPEYVSFKGPHVIVLKD